MLPAVQLTLSSCHPSLVNTDEMYFCTATLEGTCQYAAQEGRCERCGQRDVANEGNALAVGTSFVGRVSLAGIVNNPAATHRHGGRAAWPNAHCRHCPTLAGPALQSR